MAGLFSTVGGIIDRRQLVAVWLPLLAFVSGVGVVVVTGVGAPEVGSWWTGLNTETRALAIVILVLGTVLAGQLLMARRTSLIRLYEGYWPIVRQRVPRPGRPPRPYPVPTGLGRVLRAAEEHPLRRYRIDAVTTWPRLYPVLPQRFVEAFDAAAASLEGAVVLSFLSGAFAILTTVLGGLLLPWRETLAYVAAALLLSVVAYRAAVRAAHPYGQLVRAAFDVHRFELLKAMGLTLPGSYGQERAQWGQLHKLWEVGLPDSEHAQSLGYPAPATDRTLRIFGSKVTPPAGTTLTAVPVANGTALSGLLRRGARITLVAGFTAEGGDERPRERFDDVVLVDTGPAGPEELVVALPASDAERLLGCAGSATVYAMLPVDDSASRLPGTGPE
ncbi:hypothetical protein ACIA6D_20975 [Streptomyces cacaoi]|uniref:hypothetical protein n=1 Tax=Streptomyces cacaoi TaxID=1898 RepID=UPI00374929AF